MKKIFGILLCFCFISVCNCSYGQEIQSDIDADEYLEKMLQAVMDDDIDLAREITISESRYTDDFQEGFSKIVEAWGENEEYTYQKKTEKELGAVGEGIISSTYHTYQIHAGDDLYQVGIAVGTLEDGKEGVVQFSLNKEITVTGTVSTWKEFNLLQWGMAVLAVIEIIFTIYTAIRCWRKEKRWKKLWCFAILVLYGGINISWAKYWTVGVFIYTMSLPKLLIYSNGAIQLQLSVPIGAIAYYLWDKKISRRIPNRGDSVKEFER